MVVSPKSGILQIFFTRHLVAVTDPTPVEIRYRDLIFFERAAHCRFFELPIAMIALLSFENYTSPYEIKRYEKRKSNISVDRFYSRFMSRGLDSFSELRRVSIAIGSSKKRERSVLSKNIRSRYRISTFVGSVLAAKCLVKKI